MPAEDEISLNAKSHIIQSDIRDDFRQINIHVQGTGQQPDQSIIGAHDRDDQQIVSGSGLCRGFSLPEDQIAVQHEIEERTD